MTDKTDMGGRLESLRERALQVERRADGQPAWMKGSLVFADRPVRESLPDLEPKTPPPPPSARI